MASLKFVCRRWFSAAAAEGRPRGGGRFTDSSGLGPKRFYREVDLVEEEGQERFVVCLDGKQIKTPNLNVLGAKSKTLATAIASEWDLQGKRLRLTSMPLTHLMNTALDVVPVHRDRSIQTMLKFMGTDTVCYRSRYPDSLAEEQQRRWDPILDYLAQRYDVRLNVTQDLVFIDQPEHGRDTFTKWLSTLDDIRIAALESAIASSKSFAVGVALHDGQIDAKQAVR